ncbi:unnamed protein product [Cylicocyclus nassatus]|uniref:G-protein coupled receptors family 1 profile domain-containing protein n=1 Tax=Cylicocyclus nassatus TaxID=53992 RepID=A0AA36GPV6_CYLNA|nr:unnamed protein product [Cylicocyclus nassatus]
MDSTLLLPYQIFYITIPLLGILGNFALIYVTIRCRKLRSVCNILIALISAGYIMQLFSHLVMVISYNFSFDHKTRLETCLYWQILPFFSTGHAEILLLCVTMDRMLSMRKFYYHFVYSYKFLYTTLIIFVATALGVCVTSVAYLYKGPNDK